MDQVKAVLAVMKKQAFWILIGVVVLVGIGVWFAAASALAARYAARKTELETKYTTVSGIKSEASGETAEHPNEEKIQRWLSRVGKNRVEALNAWKVMFDIQKELNKWPGSLSPRFHAMIKTVEEKDLPIPNEFLEEYQTFIKKHFPEMDMIIDRRKPKEIKGLPGAVPGMPGAYGGDMGYTGDTMGGYAGDTMGGYAGDTMGGGYEGDMYGDTGGMMMAGTEMEGIVEWVDSDYARIQAGVYWVTRPLTVEVRLAQEDLWVYESLLRAIAKTNSEVGATSYYNAAVKKIWALEIGQPAAAAMKSAKTRLGLGARPMGAEGEMYSEDYSADMSGGTEMYADDGMGGDMYGEGMGPATNVRDPEMVAKRLLTGRYVDLTGEPQAADSMPYAEFKLMPVHIAVTMDQQKLPDFLVNLANSEMPVDVKQVSIQASGKMAFATGATGGYGGGDMMGGYGGDMMGGYGGDMMGGYGGDMMGASDAESTGDTMGAYGSDMGGYGAYGGAGGATVGTAEDVAKQDVPIEIFGVIRIFNPPDMAKLGTGSATDESSEGPVAAAPPADAPTMPGAAEISAPGAGPATGPGPAPGAGPAPAPGPVPAAGAGPATGPPPGPAPGPAPGPGAP